MKKKRVKKKSHKGLIVFLVICIVLAAAAGAVYFWFMSQLEPVSSDDESVALVVEEGQTKDEVLQKLQDEGLIRSKEAADLYSKFHSGFSYYAGTYELKPSMSVEEIFDYMSDPANLALTYAVVTIPEGTWAKDIAHKLAQAVPSLDEQRLLDLWNDEEYIRSLASLYPFIDPEALNNDAYFIRLEGYLYPETYYFDLDLNEDEATRMMLDGFAQFYEAHKAEFDASSWSVQEIVTLASVIQFESGNVSEMADISGVFKNRLEQGMPLQSSVTVCYALYDQFDSPQDCETNTEIDSPYNTYMHDGLPVGPILNPGADAMLAALHPADNDYLYFVGDIHGDGSTHFARTYEEHLANIEKYGLTISDSQ